MAEKRRPYLKLRAYTWKAADGTETPGVALTYCNQIRAHLTPAEARTMADKLHDLADRVESETTP